MPDVKDEEKQISDRREIGTSTTILADYPLTSRGIHLRREKELVEERACISVEGS